jgi:CheY-like chemotaxis protein
VSVKCRAGEVVAFEAPVRSIDPTGMFIGAAERGLSYMDLVSLTFQDETSEPLTVEAKVVSIVPRRGVRVEVLPNTPRDVLEAMLAWSEGRPYLGSVQKKPTPVPSIDIEVLDAISEAPEAPPPPARAKTPPSWSIQSTLPLSPWDAPQNAADADQPRLRRSLQKSPQTRSTSRLNLSGLRVLVVDDDPLVLSAMRRILIHLGCEVEATQDPPAALELLYKKRVDAVLLDWMLPKIPGQDMLAELRNSYSDVAVAIVSGALWWDGADDYLRSLGAAKVLHKPIEIDDIAGWLGTLRGGAAAAAG